MDNTEIKTKGQEEEKKEKNAIEKYNVGTLKMYISPEIIETNKSGDFKKRKLSKMYYLRKYTRTPSELQQTQKINGQTEPVAPPVAKVAQAAPIAAPAGPPPGIAPPLNQNLVPKVGGLFSTNNFDSDNSPTAINSPTVVNRPSGMSQYNNNSSGYSNESIANKPNFDSEPYISSLIKFTTAGFPPNSTVKSRVDTFFNIKLFRAYLKKLGEPITLFDTNNKTISPNMIDGLSPASSSSSDKPNEKKRIEDGNKNVIQIKSQNEEELKKTYYKAFNACSEFISHRYDIKIFGTKFNSCLNNWNISKPSYWYTPEIVSKAVAQLTLLQNGVTIYDPAVGIEKSRRHPMKHWKTKDWKRRKMLRRQKAAAWQMLA
jgi:hypothetical protein